MPVNFPQISPEQRLAMLAPPTGQVRVVIDTDAKNEIDDQFALAWAFLSQDILKIEGVYAAPYSLQYRLDGLIRTYELKDKDELSEEDRELSGALRGTYWQFS